MPKRTIQQDVLDGIELNIAITESQIHQLHLAFSTIGIGGRKLERRLILAKLHVLEDTLQLLKLRRVYASKITLH